ncbi:MAG TPA: hypothetical protein GXX46_12395 [Peptococcaceae bacterium]|nr:hypothetical protein [Peptococcaceae bacterium]
MIINNKKLHLSFLQKALLFTMLIEAQFFYIFPLPKFFWLGNNPNNKSYIILILYFVIIMLLIANKFKIRLTKYFSFVRPYLIIQVLIAVILIIRSKLLYDQSWFDMTQCADYLFMPLTAIAFLIAFKNEIDYRKMMYVLFWVILICQIVIFVQGIVIRTTGVTFCFGMRETGEIAIRAGMVRSARNCLNFIGIGYSINCLINRINRNESYISKRLNILMFALSIFNLLFFNGYRTIILSTFAMMLVIVIFSKKFAIPKKTLVLIFVMLLLFGFGVYDSIIDFFSLDGKLAGSTLVRIGAAIFFWNRFIENPIFGFGMVRPYTDETWQLFGGDRIYAVTDAGIIGLLSEVGLLGFFTYFVLFGRGLYIVTKLKDNRERSFLIGILVYILASSPALIITNISRCFAIPVCMAIFESVYYRHKAKQNEEIYENRA